MGPEYVSELRPPTGILLIVQMIHEYGKPRWNDIDRGKRKNSEKTLSQCHFVHHKSTWTDKGANPGIRRERPATNHLSHNQFFCGNNDSLSALVLSAVVYHTIH
jgi:hypothetical protein